MFEIDRTFSQRNPKSGLMEWYFSAREGTFGPYTSSAFAKKALADFIVQCKKLNDDGGRKSGKKKTLGMLPDGFNLVGDQHRSDKRSFR